MNTLRNKSANPWSEMRTYLEDRLSGKKPIRPGSRKLAR